MTSSTLGGETSWVMLAAAGGDVAVLRGVPLLPRILLPRPLPVLSFCPAVSSFSCPASALPRSLVSPPACPSAMSSPTAERDVAELVPKVDFLDLRDDWAAAIGSPQAVSA